jgi:hypothetical protein
VCPSSTSSTRGSVSSARAIDRRFCIRGVRAHAGRAASVRPTAASTSCARATALRRRRPWSRAKKTRFSRPEIRR